MPNLKHLLFIDANQYLQLFRIVEGKALLQPLQKVCDFIFLTAQVVDEVNRNKLEIAQRFLTLQLQSVQVKTGGMPDHLFGIDAATFDSIRSQLRTLSRDKDSLVSKLTGIVENTLSKIAASQDDVSVALASLFSKARTATPDELERARLRRELGNPPGKIGNPLGDQISWEQLLAVTNSVTSVWIISNDSDYFASFGKKLYLNSFLSQELRSKGCSEVHLYNNLLRGLEDFGKHISVPVTDSITDETKKQLERDLASPTDAIVHSWKELFSAAKAALVRRGVNTHWSFRGVSLALQELGILEGSLLVDVEWLRRMRNSVVHDSQFLPTPVDAVIAQTISKRAIAHLNQ